MDRAMAREERDGHRRRSRSRDRERYRSRSRSRSRERRRDREDERYSRRRRDDSRREDRGRDHDDDDYDYEERRERYREKDRDRWRSEDYYRDDRIEQGPVVMLRNLIDTVRKDDIIFCLASTMSYVKDVRLIQRGGTHSFAFIEFHKTEDANRWMDENKDTLEILGSPVNVEYSRHKRLGTEGDRDRSYGEKRDWVCFKCRTVNFARRRLCMTCDCSRSESDSLHEDVRQGRIDHDDREGDRDDNNPPSNVLILRGLDALSTEDSVRAAITALSTHPLKDVRLIRDKSTNTSRGFCFVELHTIEEAKELLEKLRNEYPAFFVDGRRVSASYARQGVTSSGSKSAVSSVASAAIAQAQWSMKQQTGGWNSQQQSVAQGKSSGAWLQQTQASSLTSTDETVVQQAYPQGTASGQYRGGGKASAADTKGQQTSDQEKGSSEQYPSTYAYDPTSGFYYDSATGLYYDPKTQYHYNSQTGQYCYYDTAQQAYIAVNSDGTPVAAGASTAATTKEKKKKDGSATLVATAGGGAKSAKKIAKDMERWAKSVNAAKTAQQQQLQALIQQEMVEAQVFQSATQPPVPMGGAGGEPERLAEMKMSGVALSAALKGEDTIDKSALATLAAEVNDMPVGGPLPLGADPNPIHTDWNQLACLLCKRKFPSREVLIKHQQFSDLHKQNLEKEKKAQTATGASDRSEIRYRDRAKERRDKFGLPDAIIPGWKRRVDKELSKDPPIPFEQPTTKGIQEDNIGSKMLQSMGWSKGQGLGKSKQGITEPIKAEMRQSSAGLGAPGSSYGIYSATGNYKDTLKQLTRARFEEAFK